MIPQCRDQGLGISAFSPLARGLLSCDFSSVRNKTDFFTQEMYADVTSLNIAQSVERVAKIVALLPLRLLKPGCLITQEPTAC